MGSGDDNGEGKWSKNVDEKRIEEKTPRKVLSGKRMNMDDTTEDE